VFFVVSIPCGEMYLRRIQPTGPKEQGVWLKVLFP
jgi:hypothetical protein